MDGGSENVSSDHGNADWQSGPDGKLSDQKPYTPSPPQTSPASIEWTASEFIDHNKGSSWYVLLILGSVAIAAGLYFLSKNIFSAGIVVLVALLLGIAAIRKPRVLQYSINNSGLSIGQKRYAYKDFKSFAVMQEGAVASVLFLPLKRFMPPISIYCDPNDEDRIVNLLAYYLPFEHHEHDVLDRLAQRIHF